MATGKETIGTTSSPSDGYTVTGGVFPDHWVEAGNVLTPGDGLTGYIGANFDVHSIMNKDAASGYLLNPKRIDRLQVQINVSNDVAFWNGLVTAAFAYYHNPVVPALAGRTWYDFPGFTDIYNVQWYPGATNMSATSTGLFQTSGDSGLVVTNSEYVTFYAPITEFLPGKLTHTIDLLPAPSSRHLSGQVFVSHHDLLSAYVNNLNWGGILGVSIYFQEVPVSSDDFNIRQLYVWDRVPEFSAYPPFIDEGAPPSIQVWTVGVGQLPALGSLVEFTGLPFTSFGDEGLVNLDDLNSGSYEVLQVLGTGEGFQSYDGSFPYEHSFIVRAINGHMTPGTALVGPFSGGHSTFNYQQSSSSPIAFHGGSSSSASDLIITSEGINVNYHTGHSVGGVGKYARAIHCSRSGLPAMSDQLVEDGWIEGMHVLSDWHEAEDRSQRFINTSDTEGTNDDDVTGF